MEDLKDGGVDVDLKGTLERILESDQSGTS